MSKDTVAGKLKNVGGKIKQSVGEAVGDQKMANEGAADRVKGATQETWGKTKDTARDISDTTTTRKTTTSGKKVRDGVAGAVEDAKDSISRGLHNLSNDVHEHERDRDGREVHQVQ